MKCAPSRKMTKHLRKFLINSQLNYGITIKEQLFTSGWGLNGFWLLMNG